ncbi:MAG: xanthine dehydrogenase family protein subunit M [bacterium]
MILPDFDYFRPASLEETAELLREHGPQCRLVAGGTDLLPNMKNNLVRPKAVISLQGIRVREPELTAEGFLRVDAKTTLADLAISSLVREQAPLLAESALEVASNQIRQMGTLGGNLCQESRCLHFNQSHEFQFQEPCYKLGGDCCYPYPGVGKSCLSVFMSDTAPALICLEAQVEVYRGGKTRKMPLADLYTQDGLNPLTLGQEEIVTAVLIPAVSPRSGGAFEKNTTRGGVDFAIVSVAVWLRLENDGATCAEVRICLGSVAGGPLRAPKAESQLAGNRLDEAAIAAAGSNVSEEIRPVPHHGYPLGFLKHIIRVYSKRALKKAWERATS